MFFTNIESDFHAVFLAAITLLAILNPFGNLTQFIYMSNTLPINIRQKLFRNILYTAFIIVMLFLLIGPYIMTYVFRVNLDDLRIAGGLILIIMNIKNLLFSDAQKDEYVINYEQVDEKELLKKSLIPMAFPMLVGPGTLASVVVISEDGGLNIAILSIIFSFLFMFLLFHFAAMIEKIFGKLILHVFSRIAQVFIIAMGAKMIIIGIKGIFNL